MPTSVHRPNIALSRRDISSDTPQLDRQTENLFQSASLLPEQYGSTLDSEAMRVDAFYALSELLTFVATSEKQFLNSIELRLNHEISSTNSETDISIANFKYSRELLDCHSQILEETLRFLKKKDSSRWPTAPADHHKFGLIKSKHEAVIEDFEYLLSLANRLSLRCFEEVGLITDNAMLQESRRVMDQGEQVKTLTLLAFFCLPMTIASGFFGMNFKELGQGDLSIWIGVMAIVLLSLLQYLAYVLKDPIIDTWKSWNNCYV